jgi:tetratricopeptide (TPR) repeat protein
MKRYGFVSLFVFALAAGAQDQQTSHISGRIHSSDPVLHGYVVELEELNRHGGGAPPQADVQVDGEFTVRNVPYGEYLLKVMTYAGEVVTQQLVAVHDRESPIDLQLPKRAPVPAGTTVSFGELRHPPARKAIAAAAAAQRFAQAGHTDRAAGELEKALRISPDYAAAHSNLAVQYLRLGRYEDARAEIERALAISGPNALDYANLAFAYAALQRVDDAMAAARRALAIDRHSASAHYLLGALLALTPATRGEGIAHLEAAAETIPAARRDLEKWTH